MKKFLVTVLLSSSILVVGGFGLWKTDTQLPWQKIIEHAGEKVPDIERIELVFHNGSEYLNVYDFVDVDLSNTGRSLINWLTGSPLAYNSSWEINKESLLSLLKGLRLENVNASIDTVDNKLVLKEEVVNREFELNSVFELIETNLGANSSTVIDVVNLCSEPEVTVASLQPSYDSISWINDFRVSYENGSVIDSSILLNAYDSESETLDTSKLDFSSVFDKLYEHYDTTDGSYTLNTSTGKTVIVPYKTYGYSINEDKETEFLLEAIESKQSYENRKPEISGFDSIEGTYIEVSIDSQHVWHYVDGVLCCETDCVTGTKGKHDTPVGVFFVSERIGGKYLTGDTYRTWVNQWMRLTNSGVGLHDAYWRRKFGGNIYAYDGSHGCINLPASYAKKLFNEIRRGVPVIIYYAE